MWRPRIGLKYVKVVHNYGQARILQGELSENFLTAKLGTQKSLQLSTRHANTSFNYQLDTRNYLTIFFKYVTISHFYKSQLTIFQRVNI